MYQHQLIKVGGDSRIVHCSLQRTKWSEDDFYQWQDMFSHVNISSFSVFQGETLITNFILGCIEFTKNSQQKCQHAF